MIIDGLNLRHAGTETELQHVLFTNVSQLIYDMGRSIELSCKQK